MINPPQEFLDFYSELYQNRWPDLYDALLAEETQIARINAFAENIQNDLNVVNDTSFINILDPKLWIQNKEISRASNGVLSYYVMDPASIFAAKALCVEPGDYALDMCAAPGGKALILAESHPAELTANELSVDRRGRLIKVIQQYIPREKRENIFVTGKDGGKFALTHKSYFDKILVDAPCSGERHVLRSPKDLNEWSLAKTKKLAKRQYALLTAALLAAKPGAKIVYSTCSISNLENDLVIDELLKRKGENFYVEELSEFKSFKCRSLDCDGIFHEKIYSGEKTKHGCIFLPDKSGIGPIYFCILRKKN